MMKRLAVAALFATGCSTSVDTGPSGARAAETSTAIVGPQIISCATDSNGTACQYTPPQGYPISFSSVATLISSTSGTTQSATLDDGAVHTLTAGAGAELLIQVDATSGIKGLINGDLSMMQQLGLAAGTQTFTVPYDIWPIQLTGSASMQTIAAAKISIDVSPWETFFGSATASTTPSLPEKPVDQTITTAVAVAHGMRSINGTAVFCASSNCSTQPYVLSGPGTYAVSTNGLAPAADSATSDGGTADMTQPPPITPTPDMATPVCGGASQPPCTDEAGNPTCVTGTVYLWASNLCAACGNDRQPACTDSGNNQVCNAGTVNVNGMCNECGENQQPVCRDASDNAYCDPGYALTSDGADCASCGAAGQIPCRDVSNNAVCNGGLTVDASGLCD